MVMSLERDQICYTSICKKTLFSMNFAFFFKLNAIISYLFFLACVAISSVQDNTTNIVAFSSYSFVVILKYFVFLFLCSFFSFILFSVFCFLYYFLLFCKFIFSSLVIFYFFLVCTTMKSLVNYLKKHFSDFFFVWLLLIFCDY